MKNKNQQQSGNAKSERVKVYIRVAFSIMMRIKEEEKPHLQI